MILVIIIYQTVCNGLKDEFIRNNIAENDLVWLDLLRTT